MTTDGITLQRLSRAGGYTGPNDGVRDTNTWRPGSAKPKVT